MRKNFIIAIVAIMAIAISGGMAMGAHSGNHVNPDSVDTTNDTYGSIQNAVDNATDNDTIVIEPGTYNENVTVNTANLTLESSTSGEYVVIDGNVNTTNTTGFEMGEYVTTISDSSDSDGGSGGIISAGDETLQSEYMGIPLMVWLLLVGVIVVLFVAEYTGYFDG